MARAPVTAPRNPYSQSAPILIHEPVVAPYGPHGAAAIAKRLLDFVLLVPATILALPIIVLAAILIMAISPGNPFYSQRREGYRGRSIRIWKLRTMRPDADAVLEQYLRTDPEARDEWSSHYKLTRDPRILPLIGKALRRSSLDELPQLWNIASGEMSFVGPRPFPEYHLAAFGEDFRAQRRSAVPGLTGLWQVSERAEGDLSRQEYWDRRYLEDWSLTLDVGILLRTPLAVVRGKGAC